MRFVGDKLHSLRINVFLDGKELEHADRVQRTDDFVAVSGFATRDGARYLEKIDGAMRPSRCTTSYYYDRITINQGGAADWAG